MPDYDVRLTIMDEDQNLDLEVYQRVSGAVDESRESLIERAKQQFCAWAWRRGPRWARVGARIPFAAVVEGEVIPVGPIALRATPSTV
ncbi:MAG: hypothetical protein ACFCUQ_21950 [Kiloniellales bacterium]